jgi:hypothetical protein
MSQAAEPIRRCLPAPGSRIGTYLILWQRNEPYINSEPFVDDLRRVFLPYLSDFHRSPELTDEEAMFLMNNCPSYVTQQVIDLLTQAPLRVIMCAPHTRNILQVLDFTLFGVFNRHGQYHLPFETGNPIANFIFETCKDFHLQSV